VLSEASRASNLVLIACALALVAVGIGCRGGTAPAPVPPPVQPIAAVTEESRSSASPTRDWPVPAGWKSETIPFPLDFAPKLAHRGVEELRFAPGMFDPTAPGYWSYAFVWWLEDRPLQDGAALGAELTEYFRGLLGMVAEQRAARPKAGAPAAPIIDPSAISCSLRSDGERGAWQQFAGEAVVLDAFGDGRRVPLRLVVLQRDVATAGRRAVLVLASPADRALPIWRQLDEVAGSFAPR
jgi:hypothetical protein